jgi:hypothetical protein
VLLNHAVLLIGFGCVGRRLQANAEASDEVVDPPKVEDKIGAVPNGLSTDSDVAKRFVILLFMNPHFHSVHTHKHEHTVCLTS